MKKTIENICVWILGKLNIERLKSLTIDSDRITLGLSKVLPDDGKWHHVGTTVACYMKVSPKGRKETKIDEVVVFLDGKKKAKAELKTFHTVLAQK